MPGKRVDLNLTMKIMGETLAWRLVGALGDAALDYGEEVRDMRVCLAKANLYIKLFVDKVEHWSMIPYVYKPEDELEKLVESVFRQRLQSQRDGSAQGRLNHKPRTVHSKKRVTAAQSRRL